MTTMTNMPNTLFNFIAVFSFTNGSKTQPFVSQYGAGCHNDYCDLFVHSFILSYVQSLSFWTSTHIGGLMHMGWDK